MPAEQWAIDALGPFNTDDRYELMVTQPARGTFYVGWYAVGVTNGLEYGDCESVKATEIASAPEVVAARAQASYERARAAGMSDTKRVGPDWVLGQLP